MDHAVTVIIHNNMPTNSMYHAQYTPCGRGTVVSIVYCRLEVGRLIDIKTDIAIIGTTDTDTD